MKKQPTVNNKPTFRKKRSDTKIGTVEKQYNRDFGVRADKKLGTYLKEMGVPSLAKLLKIS